MSDSLSGKSLAETNDCCMFLRGCSFPCKDGKFIDELVTTVDNKGNLLSLTYVLEDGSSLNVCDENNQERLKLMNVYIHQNMTEQLIEMQNNKVFPRVKLTCNGEKNISIKQFLIKLGFQFEIVKYAPQKE
jgi:hypothetical protein